MQFKFLTLYHNFSNEEKNLVDAQRSLLSVWQNAVFEGKIKFTLKATVEFKAYSFFEYPDSTKAIKEIKVFFILLFLSCHLFHFICRCINTVATTVNMDNFACYAT